MAGRVPAAAPPRETWESNPLYRQLDAQFTQHHAENPGYTGLHFMAAYELEECWQLLRQSLHSVSYEALAHVPSYADWLSRQDWTPSYCRHRRNLQLIGLNDAEKRWVLKNPSHLFALDALMATYPDALVVQTHRPVETIMASMCSLAQHTTEGWSTKFVGAQIGADAMDTWSRGLERFNAARAKYDSAQFYDVDYHDLIADPLGTVADIYRHFGLTLSDEARQAMTTVHAEPERCPGPKSIPIRWLTTGSRSKWSKSGSPGCDSVCCLASRVALVEQIRNLPASARQLASRPKLFDYQVDCPSCRLPGRRDHLIARG